MYVGSGYITYRFKKVDFSIKSRVDGSLTEITADMLDGVTNIRSYAFYNYSALISVTIPNSVTSIGISDFNSCSALASVTIPSSITSIANYAFNGCRVLASVIVEATTPPTLGINVFSNTSNNLVIYVPAGSVDTYKVASGWSDYASKIQAIPST